MDEELLREKAERVVTQKNVLLKHLYNKPELDVDDVMNTLLQYREMVAPYVCDVALFLDKATRTVRKYCWKVSWAPSKILIMAYIRW